MRQSASQKMTRNGLHREIDAKRNLDHRTDSPWSCNSVLDDNANHDYGAYFRLRKKYAQQVAAMKRKAEAAEKAQENNEIAAP